MPEFVSGALVMAYVVAALFFLRFWRDTREPLFKFFTAAFLIFAVQRTALTLLEQRELLALAAYGLRIVGFLLIAAGVVAANLAHRRRSGPPPGA
jgi:amino acid transporter